MSHVDLHLHLLPGVDDGAPHIEAALEHAERMVRDGVDEAVATPHVGPIWPVDVGELHDRTDAVRAALAAAGVPLRLHAGAELHHSVPANLTDAELDLVAQGPPGARWVLLEIPFGGIDTAFAATCAELRARGFGVLIAHPERARGFLTGGLRLLRPALQAGALLQVNACSLRGDHGEEARDAAERLLRRGLAYVVASDGHPGTRMHTLALGADEARRAGLTWVQARRLTHDNPRFLLRHGIPAGVPARPARPRRDRSRLDVHRSVTRT
jgi:protein-tyrosine phosphatase